MRPEVFDLVSLCGFVLLVAGMALVHPALCLVVAGVMLIGVGVWAARQWAKQRAARQAHQEQRARDRQRRVDAM